MPTPFNPKGPLLEPLDSVVIPAMPAPFAIRDAFKKSDDVMFSTIWDDFKKRFFDKIENPCGEVSYRKYKLLQIAPDGPIIAELGGEAKVAGTIYAAVSLFKRQGRGQAGFLQTNGYANIFYVKDAKGELCAIRTGWAEDGWVIDAISVADPLAWNGKHLIFCPMSV